jgi:hypothetical protein
MTPWGSQTPEREKEKVAHQQTLPGHRSLGYREAATWYSYYSSDMISSHISRSGREMWDENLLAHVIPERELQQVWTPTFDGSLLFPLLFLDSKK